MINLATLRPIQSMAASVFFRHKRLLLCLPRQYGGKTELGVRLTHDLLLDSNPKQALFLAKDKKSAKRAVREKHQRIFEKELFKINTELVYSKHRPDMACFIESVDKDPDRIRGGTYGLVHWSEVAFSKIEHGFTIQDVFDKVVKPTVELNEGYVILESTNNGMNGWKDLWDNGEKDYGFKKLLVSFSQMAEMGLVSRETYDRIKATTHPDVFRQEYECEWVTFQGKVYSEFDLNRHVNADIAWPEPWQTVVAGIDWGFNDATAIVFAYVRDGKTYIFDEIYLRKKTLEEVMVVFNQHKGVLWKCGNFAAKADHDPAKNQELNRRGIPCVNAEKSDTLGNRLQVKEKFFKNEIFIHPRCKMTIKDLSSATWDMKKLNEIDYDQCTWGHFDCEAATRYLIRGLSDYEEEKPMENPHLGQDDASAVAWEMAQRRKMDNVRNSWGN
jgi:hypothetical protein